LALFVNTAEFMVHLFITRPFLNQLICVTVIITTNNWHYLSIQLTSRCRACFNKFTVTAQH